MSVGDKGTKSWKQQADEIAAAITNGDAVICLTRCESCQFGSHYDEPTRHSWAGPEDVAHAKVTGQKDPSDSRCGCACAKATS
jgi:hypothetical protein